MTDLWALIVIVWMNGQWGFVEDSIHLKMDECFARREELVEKFGRPIVDYQAVCVHYKNQTL